MLNILNFPRRWIEWMRECVTTATANVLVNGSPSGEFRLERGVRQGDPLSPYLFLVAAGGLNLVVKNAIKEGIIKAVKVGRDKVEVSHLQYADDTIFMVEGNVGNAKALKRILQEFELISGLSINYDKSSAYGVNLDQDSLGAMAGELGCNVGEWPIPYLGLRVGCRNNGVAAWKGVLDKIKGRLSKWEVSMLSMGGRLTIIKSVLSAIPIYNLSFSKLPKTVERTLISLLSRFLWGGKGDGKKLAWVSWSKICKPMSEGGLGVRNLGAFNKALLGKWVWRFNNDKNNLWTKVVKSRYGDLVWGRDGEVTEGRRKRRSGWWKNVIATVDGGDGKWFWDNVEVKLGGGAETRFWDGFWSGNQNLKQLYPRLFQLCQNKHSRVADMGSWEGGVWRWRIEWRRPLRECERAGEAGLFNLLQQYNLREGETDKWIWRGTRDGIYSVKEAYKAISKRDMLLQSEIASSTMFTGVWKARAPFKAKISA